MVPSALRHDTDLVHQIQFGPLRLVLSDLRVRCGCKHLIVYMSVRISFTGWVVRRAIRLCLDGRICGSMGWLILLGWLACRWLGGSVGWSVFPL